MNPELSQTSLQKLSALSKEKTIRGELFPKVGILAVLRDDSLEWVEYLSNLPASLANIIEEIAIFGDFTNSNFSQLSHKISSISSWRNKLLAFQSGRSLGWGGNQKVGFGYFIEKGMDQVLVIQSCSPAAWNSLIDCLFESIINKQPVVFGVPNKSFFSSRLINFFLGLKLRYSQFSNRLFSTSLLKKIPFEVNSENEFFDLEILIQSRMMGVSIRELTSSVCNSTNNYNLNVFSSLLRVLRYRLHQVGIVFDKRYLAKGSVLYTFKSSPFSSHGQILNLVKEHSEVLDIGCGTGLLSKRLAEKNVRSMGIDYEIKENVWGGFDTYIQDDLEKAGKLPRERQFDYILLADVLEHLRAPDELLRKVRPLLKKEGKLIASTGNVALWYMRLSLLLGRFNYGKKGILDETHVKLYTRYSFLQLLNQSGFQVETVLPTSLPFEVVFQSTGRSQVLRAVEAIYYRIACACAWPSLFAYQFVVQASSTTFEISRVESKIPT